MNPNPSSLPTNCYPVTLTAEGWLGLERSAEKFNCSVSELLDRLGLGNLAIVDPADLEDYLDLQETLDLEANPENQQRVSWEQVKKELGL